MSRSSGAEGAEGADDATDVESIGDATNIEVIADTVGVADNSSFESTSFVSTAGRALSPGQAEGHVLTLSEPLSFWGGVDPISGDIIDQRHPQVGKNMAGKILVLERGRGSSSGSSVLAEAIRAGTGPAGIVMAASDEIIALGAIVADEIYGIQVPVIVVDQVEYIELGRYRSVSIAMQGNVPQIVGHGYPKSGLGMG